MSKELFSLRLLDGTEISLTEYARSQTQADIGDGKGLQITNQNTGNYIQLGWIDAIALGAILAKWGNGKLK